MKTKICHITTIHPTRDTRIFYKECKSLAKNGFNVKLIVINGVNFNEDGVEAIGVPCKYSGRLQRFNKASEAAYKNALELDAEVYHFHDPEFLPFAIKLIKKGKKAIYDVHEDLPRQMLGKYWIPKFIRKAGSKIIEVMENKYSKKMSGIVTATSHIKERFLSFNKNTIEVRNYPLTDLIQGAEKAAKTNNEICYIGTITKFRGISEVIKSLPIVNDEIRLNLAGVYHPENYKDELKQFNGWDKVNEFGFIDFSNINKILQRSIAGIVTLHPIINYLDALPVKMFEYMATGTPVITSDFPLWRKIIDENKCGICVDPTKPEEIAKAINYIFHNPDEACKLSQNGIRAVKEKYNWTREEKKLIDIYKSILDK